MAVGRERLKWAERAPTGFASQIVELWEVEKFGRDSFGDRDAVALYGIRPAEWYAKGVRILARTTLVGNAEKPDEIMVRSGAHRTL
jgi:hypothetical protein